MEKQEFINIIENTKGLYMASYEDHEAEIEGIIETLSAETGDNENNIAEWLADDEGMSAGELYDLITSKEIPQKEIDKKLAELSKEAEL